MLPRLGWDLAWEETASLGWQIISLMSSLGGGGEQWADNLLSPVVEWSYGDEQTVDRGGGSSCRRSHRQGRSVWRVLAAKDAERDRIM